MKKTLLLSVVCFLFALQGAMAYTTQTKLQLRAYDNSPILVNVDGTNFGAYTNSQSIENLSPGLSPNAGIRIVGQPYTGANSQQLIYSGGITLAENRMMDAVVNPGNNLQIISDVAICLPNQPVKVRIPERNIPTYNPAQVANLVAMCQAEFNEFMCTLNKQWFDDTKTQVAKHMLNSHYVTAYQVKQMLGAFSFESSKLDIAKYAYGKTVDQDRYYVVYDAFTFSSSISEMTCFVNDQHNGDNNRDHYSHNNNQHDGYNNSRNHYASK